jgi:hypothetical protein
MAEEEEHDGEAGRDHVPASIRRDAEQDAAAAEGEERGA